jgi:hypothetical protein
MDYIHGDKIEKGFNYFLIYLFILILIRIY